MGRLGVRRYEGWEESHRYDLPEPSRIQLPDGPPATRRRDIADVAKAARVHRPATTLAPAGLTLVAGDLS